MSSRINPSLISPLRYPGGKGALAPFLGQLISVQPTTPTTYVEPFAGGAGAALRLLYDEHVERVVLNDIDAGIAAMWRSILHETESFARRILTCRVSLRAWAKARSTYLDPNGASDLELGFATFFLNRTNRSGILKARPIGGMEQTGKWKIDARFNREDLAARVRLIGRYSNRIEVQQRDGVDVAADFLRRSSPTFVYVDPPYLNKGGGLYLDTLTWADHQRLAKVLRRARARQWMLTYDHDSRVPELYSGLDCHAFDIAHTAARQHVGKEYAVFSAGLLVDDVLSLSETQRRRRPLGLTT